MAGACVYSALLLAFFCGSSALKLNRSDDETLIDASMASEKLMRDLGYLSSDVSHTQSVDKSFLDELGWYRHHMLQVRDKGNDDSKDNMKMYVSECSSLDDAEKETAYEEEFDSLYNSANFEPSNGRVEEEARIKKKQAKEAAKKKEEERYTHVSARGRNRKDLLGLGDQGRNMKGRCNYCAFVFAYTDDPHDLQQDIDREESEFCGMKQVHRGFKEQADGYIYHNRFSSMMHKMIGNNCQNVIFAGHSLGGAVASLMAFCANNVNRPKGYEMFNSVRQNVGLVTFGAPAPSKHPLYNGMPTVPFRGQRFGITDPGLKPISMACGTEGMELLAKVVADLGSRDSKRLMKFIPKMKEFATKGNRKSWTKEMQTAAELYMPYTNEAYRSVLNILPDEKHPLCADLHSFMRKYKSELSWEFDPILVANAFHNFVHPLIAYQGIVHPLGMNKHQALRHDIEFQLDHVWQPIWSPILVHFGMFGSKFYDNTQFSNHALCCYIQGMDESQGECSSHFKYPGANCRSQNPPTYR